MKVYYEDGPLTDGILWKTATIIKYDTDLYKYRIDASEGYTNNLNELKRLINSDFDSTVYTNSVACFDVDFHFLDNYNVYIRQDGEWIDSKNKRVDLIQKDEEEYLNELHD